MLLSPGLFFQRAAQRYLDLFRGAIGDDNFSNHIGSPPLA